ncbi:putative DNA binding domain-containing protein [bacterium]|nr:putative DNA binding domain-containing protein [bacterium]
MQKFYSIGAETEQIEFKKSTGELKEAVISIASILNKHGSGKLYFGVKNNGEVIGQEISENTLRDVSQAISYHIKPAIYPEIAVKTYGKLKVICVKFDGNRAPYLAYNIPRIRVADEDKVMDQETYDELLSRRSDTLKSWELQVSEYTLNDIVETDFKSYLKKAKDVGRIDFESDEPAVVMEKLELLAKDGVHLLNAGAVLFCPSSMNDVQMAKFATNVKATFTDIRREDRGSIIGLSRICTQYIIDAIDWKADIVGLKRVETPEIPLEAVRETIINSYGHRLYNNNQCNEIDVFKDRIEIHTTGGFPQGHTPEEFFDGKKKAIRRNKLITGVLYYSKDMETFATGLKRIKDLCDEAGCKVDFRTEKEDFVVVFYRNLRETWNVGVKSDANLDANGANSGVKNTEKVLSVKTIELIKKNPKITQVELAAELNVSRRTIQRLMAELARNGKIQRIGGTRGEWIAK